MTRAIQWQRRAFAVSALCLIVWTMADPKITIGWQLVALTALILLVGLPHGALDPLLARRVGLWKNARGLFGFLALYLLVTAVALAVWMVHPGLALAAFIALSALHFSNDWRGELGTAYRIAGGLAIVTLPPFFHTTEVKQLFTWLSTAQTADLLTDVSVILAPLVLAATLGGLLLTLKKHPQTSLELLAIIATSALLPPLLFFTLYFCAQHSPRHLIHVVSGMQPAVITLTATALTAVAGLGGLLAFLLMPAAALEETVVRILFVGLAALTVPHMLLVAVATRRQSLEVKP